MRVVGLPRRRLRRGLPDNFIRAQPQGPTKASSAAAIGRTTCGPVAAPSAQTPPATSACHGPPTGSKPRALWALRTRVVGLK